ncbi:MAG TPA: hypothetical protein VHF25_17160 [Nitriliruptorales bacterium]|nr:hypothetical protein [Nitriliruptorales bacterium]
MADALYGAGELAIVTDARATVVAAGTRPHDVKPINDGFVVADVAGRRSCWSAGTGRCGGPAGRLGRGGAAVLLVGRDGAVRAQVPVDHEPHDLDVTGDGARAWGDAQRHEPAGAR